MMTTITRRYRIEHRAVGLRRWRVVTAYGDDKGQFFTRRGAAWWIASHTWVEITGGGR